MNDFLRPVDQAMDADRPAKMAVRMLWLSEVKAVAESYPEKGVPWYLTLPGPLGKDIKMLLEDGLVLTTESGAIDEADSWKVVAVEASNLAVASLQSELVGLRIKQSDVKGLVKGERQTRWPLGEDEEACRARIVNLDFDGSLVPAIDNGGVGFPALVWIQKLSALHADSPRIDWTLCLTLNGTISWPVEAATFLANFLDENLKREELFNDRCRAFLGNELVDNLIADDPPDLEGLEVQDMQKLIMVIVPKALADLVRQHGWRIVTKRNLMYGGEGEAPMVTWIIKFSGAGETPGTPDARYREALSGILEEAGSVTVDGEILRFLD